MSLKFTHKPDYFLYAQLFVRHLENYIVKHPEENAPNFNLQDIYDLFGKDFASASTNLEGILNIADEWNCSQCTATNRETSKQEFVLVEQTAHLEDILFVVVSQNHCTRRQE